MRQNVTCGGITAQCDVSVTRRCQDLL